MPIHPHRERPSSIQAAARPLLAIALGLITLVASGCSAAPHSGSGHGSGNPDKAGTKAHSPDPSAGGHVAGQNSPGIGPDIIMIIRHAEKPADNGPTGVDASGAKDKRSLTPQGWERAKALVDLFDPAPPNPVRAGLARPTAVFAARPDGNDSQRPSQTAQPLADHLRLPLNTEYSNGDEGQLASAIAATRGAVLVCWQHGEIPTIVKKLGKQGITAVPPPPGAWPDDRFDLIWVLTRDGDHWRFSQLAQHLLPGDPETAS